MLFVGELRNMTYKRVIMDKFDIKKSFSAREEMGFFLDNDQAPFNNDAVDFEINNAWWMMEHSRLAYSKDKKKVKAILRDVGYKKVNFIWNKTSGTKVYVAKHADHVVVSFTGTEMDEGTADFKVDADFFPSESGQGGVVHRGFRNAFDSIWNELKTLLDSYGDTPVWITGHSLGGALSVHCASKMVANGCYTFGSPRVGSKKFNQSIMTPIYRIAKNNDIVTRIPTPPVYHHHGDLYFITNDQQILKNPSMSSMIKERLGGNEMKILWMLIKLVVFKSQIEFVLEYLHGHSPYNYSVFMWNNIDT